MSYKFTKLYINGRLSFDYMMEEMRFSGIIDNEVYNEYCKRLARYDDVATKRSKIRRMRGDLNDREKREIFYIAQDRKKVERWINTTISNLRKQHISQ